MRHTHTQTQTHTHTHTRGHTHTDSACVLAYSITCAVLMMCVCVCVCVCVSHSQVTLQVVLDLQPPVARVTNSVTSLPFPKNVRHTHTHTHRHTHTHTHTPEHCSQFLAGHVHTTHSLFMHGLFGMHAFQFQAMDLVYAVTSAHVVR